MGSYHRSGYILPMRGNLGHWGESFAQHLIGFLDNHKGFWIGLVDDCGESGYLLVGYHRHQHGAFLTGIDADTGENRSSMVEFLDDQFLDLILSLAENIGCLGVLCAHHHDDIIDYLAGGIDGDDGEHGPFEAEHESRGEDDQAIHQQQAGAQWQRTVLAEDLGEDVGTPRIGAAFKHQSNSGTDEDPPEKRREQDVHRIGIGDDAAISDQFAGEAGGDRQQQHPKQRFVAILGSKDLHTDQKDGDVHAKHGYARLKPKSVVEDGSDAVHTASGDLSRGGEGRDAKAGDERSKDDEYIVFYLVCRGFHSCIMCTKTSLCTSVNVPVPLG